MRRTAHAIVLAFVVAAVAGAQSTQALEESQCPCKTQDQSFLVYDRPEELLKLIETGSEPYLLLDVRGAAEYRQGHITSAVSAPLAELMQNGLSAAKDSLIIVYCASGIRSGMAVKYLQEQGYTRVVDFGSIGRWTGDLVQGS